MANKIILACWIVISLALPAMAWNELRTAFRRRSSDTPPKTENEAVDQGWQKISDCHSGRRFAGSRWLQYVENHTMVPDKIMIYDTDGQMAGIQSLVPSEDFVGMDCKENKYYLKETINSKEYCVTTMYFTDPIFICGKKKRRRPAEDQLFIQKGAGYRKKNLIGFPKTYDEAKADPNHWHIGKYFRFMGHHTTHMVNRDICGFSMPIQGLYAWLDGECRNTGFVWSHVNTKTPDRNGWDEPRPNDVTVGLVMNNVPECMYESLEKSHVITMHVYLGGSTQQCS